MLCLGAATVVLVCRYFIAERKTANDPETSVQTNSTARPSPRRDFSVPAAQVSNSSPTVTWQAQRPLAIDGSVEVRGPGEMMATIPEEVFRRLTNGEYVLQYEIPSVRVGLSNHVSENVAQYRHLIEARYASLFRDFGVPEADAERVKAHLATIQHARVEAEAYLIQLDEAKIAYDESMKSLLGPDRYREYRQFEQQRPAIEEMAKIKDYLGEGGAITFTPEEGELITEALERGKHSPVYDGPYGVGAYASAGREKVLERLTQDVELLRREQIDVGKNLEEVGVGEFLQSAINNYYGDRIASKQREINAVAGAQ